MKGMSKALNMSLHLLVCPEKLPLPMAYFKAWSPLDITKIRLRFIPIVQLLARKLDSLFWVSSVAPDWKNNP